MDIHHLVKMANSIGDFFQTEPDKAKAAQAVANHIRSFWEPRMRKQIYSHLDQFAGEGLDELVLNALQTHRKDLEGSRL